MPRSLSEAADMMALKDWNPSKFQCTICGKAAQSKKALDMHMNIHTGVKPFVCSQEYCRARFNHPSNLRRHMRTVHRKEYAVSAGPDVTNETNNIYHL